MRSQGVHLLVQPEAVRLCPGEHEVLALTIDNPGRQSVVAHLAVRGLPREWYLLDAERVDISPGGSTHQTLALHLPTDATPVLGRYPFQVEVAGDGDPPMRATAIVNLWVEMAHQTSLDASSEDADPASEVAAPRGDAPKRRVTAPHWAVAGVILGLVALLLGFFTLPHLRHPAAPDQSPTATAHPPRSSAPAATARPPRPSTPTVRPTHAPAQTARPPRAVGRQAPTAALAPRPTNRRRQTAAVSSRRDGQAQVLLVPSAISIMPQSNRRGATTRLVRLVNLGSQRLTIVRITLSTAAHGVFNEHDTCAGRTIPAYGGCVIRLHPRRPLHRRAHARLIVVDTPASGPQQVMVTVVMT